MPPRVYGGARVGLVGAVADGVLSEGGKVIEVLPHFHKSKEVAHQQLTKYLGRQYARKKNQVNEFSDSVIALP